MLGIDTNVLIRYLVRDEPSQYEAARKLIERQARNDQPVMVSLLVLLEAEWVLRSRYGFEKSDIAAAFAALLDTAEVLIEDETSVEQALYAWKDSTADFADCLIDARNRTLGCDATATFDKRALSLGGFVEV